MEYLRYSLTSVLKMCCSKKSGILALSVVLCMTIVVVTFSLSRLQTHVQMYNVLRNSVNGGKVMKSVETNLNRENTTRRTLLGELFTDLPEVDNNVTFQAVGLAVDEKHLIPFNPLLYPRRIYSINQLQYLDRNLPAKTINHWKYSPIINPVITCAYEHNNIDVLYIVKTSPSNFRRRRTLRDTWADRTRFPNIRTVFSIGVSHNADIQNNVKMESLKYGDILLMDYIDSYDNLTLKTISGINWAAAHCTRARFVVSVDDDMYVATDFLLQYLEDLPPDPAERLYLGFVYAIKEPYRSHDDIGKARYKWVISKEEYPFSTYPIYVFGGFIVFSMRTVIDMCAAIPYTKMIKMEDVYIGIVASRLGIVPTNSVLVHSIFIRYDTEKFKTILASHYYGSELNLKNAWQCHLSNT